MSAGTFYAGIQQEDLFSLNIGFDQNTNTQTKIFYNVGSWQNASFKGSLMIRPVFGDSLWAATGVKEEAVKKEEIRVFPNPANEKIYIVTGEGSQDISVEVIDALGSTQLKQTLNTDMSVSTRELQAGFYFVRVYKESRLISTRKIIVSH